MRKKKEEKDSTYSLGKIYAEVVTEKAILAKFKDEDGEEQQMWIPKSQITEPPKHALNTLGAGDIVFMEIRDWLAKEKGLM